MVIKDDQVRPVIAVCDPLLTCPCRHLSLPLQAWMLWLMRLNRLSARNPTHVGDVGLEAIRLISRSLPKAWANGVDIEARKDMMRAQLLAGLALGISASCSGHGLARPFGAHFHVAHGLCNAFFLPEAMEFTVPACPEKFARMAEAMGEDTTGLTIWEAAMKAVDAVKNLRKMINIPTIVEYGIDAEEFRRLIPQMIKDGVASGSHRLNLRVPTEQDLAKLYEAALAR